MRGRRGGKAHINFGKIDDNFHQEAFLNVQLEIYWASQPGLMSELYNEANIMQAGPT